MKSLNQQHGEGQMVEFVLAADDLTQFTDAIAQARSGFMTTRPTMCPPPFGLNSRPSQPLPCAAPTCPRLLSSGLLMVKMRM